MSSLRLDPEFQKASATAWANVEFPPPPSTPQGFRESSDRLMAMALQSLKVPEDVTKHAFQVKSHDGVDIDVTRFATDKALSAGAPTPAVVYVHGGGFVAGSVDIFAPLIAQRAKDNEIPFFAVSYRLAPEHPAPCGVEDAYAVVKYISEHAGEFNVDAAKIAVMGDSAGGGLSAGAALLARDRGLSPPLAKMILIYPMLDDRTALAPDAALATFVSFGPRDNELCWNAYVGEEKRGRPDADVSPYAAPARAKSLRGLPPTYADVGTLDLFRDESIAFVGRLVRDDVEVEFHLLPGLPHGFDNMPGLKWETRAKASRNAAIQSIGQ